MSTTTHLKHARTYSECLHVLAPLTTLWDLPRELVDSGIDLMERNSFDPNYGTEERGLAKTLVDQFITDFLAKLMLTDGENTSLRVFCRVDMSIYVDEGKKVWFFVNEVERGISTCLWVASGPSAAGHIGSDMAWPLARWIKSEKVRLLPSGFNRIL